MTKERNAAGGGEDMLRLRLYEKLQSLVSQGAGLRGEIRGPENRSEHAADTAATTVRLRIPS